MNFEEIVKLRIALYRELENEGIVHSSIFSSNGLDKMSQIGRNNELLMLHKSIKISISEKEKQFTDEKNMYTLFDLGSYVESQIETLIKEKELEFELDEAQVPEIKISDRFLESDKHMVRIGSIPEPSKDTDSSALKEKLDDLCEAILAGIERNRFMEGYYDGQ